MILQRIRLLDYLIFGIILCAALWSGIFLYQKNIQKKILLIESPKGKWIYPIDTPRTISIPGTLGITKICIKNNTIWITDSPCPNRTCIAAPHLIKAGDWNACLPNGVFIHIEGKDDETVESVKSEIDINTQ